VATGWVPLAWVAVGLLVAVAGLGLAILVIGLPSPRSSASPATAAGNVAPETAGAPPVLVIALHGLFAVAVLALALTAAVGVG